jgi:integrase
MRELYRRASAIGGAQPDHYVFPACENGHFDPTTPQKSWRSAWRSLRKAAGIATLRFHDLRHHAITELAESQASDATIMAIAGHVSREMLEHYSHVRSRWRGGRYAWGEPRILG